jgi:hypothetical protein
MRVYSKGRLVWLINPKRNLHAYWNLAGLRSVCVGWAMLVQFGFRA